jgi:hypothetical protein
VTTTANKQVDLNASTFGLRTGPEHEYVTQGQLGLGMDSTFLTSLLRAKIIASRTYSFFWGIDSAVSANSRDGSLTIGGYDGAVLGDGASTTAKLNYEDWKCREGMKVNLTGLVIQSDGGGIQNILNSSEKLEACVVPTLSSVLWLPDHYWPIIADGMGVKLSTLNNGTSNRLFYGASRVQPNTSYVLRSSRVRH